jgi:phosphoglucosamine mutase
VLLLGPVPTPAVGMLTTSMRADVGIMISASHNPHQDNGIKFFGPDGFKLSDEAEAGIEALVEAGVALAAADGIGRATRVDDGRFRYAERVKATFPQGMRLDGLKVVIDCANGAAYRVAPEVLWELGATVIPVGTQPNGININDGVGSTHVRLAAETVVSHGADIGICLDGDADRVMILDENGEVADGDQLMALMAARWAAQGRLKGGTLVATVMSNLGLELFLAARGLRLEGWNLGGEQSGHIVMTDHATTGDGLLAGLQFLAAMVETGQSASRLARQFESVPQMLRNVRFGAGARPLDADSVKAAIAASEARIRGKGRILIRKSGTEPMVRVMAECEDERLLVDVVDEIVAAVEAAV